MKVLFILLLFTAVSNCYFAQTRTISGVISNEEDGELVIGAIVYDTLNKKGIVTNEYGFFSLSVPLEPVVLRVSSYGNKTEFVQVGSNQNQLNIILSKANATEIEEVIITGQRAIQSSHMGSVDVSMDKIDKLPVILGEKDVFRIIQLLPGVKSGGEASSGLYVRGGGPDQNLILLDGVPIYNANHLFGFFSTFNSDAISAVTLHKGGFPARYGGRASSVIDMRMKEGNLKHFNVEGSIGVIASRVLVEGPIKKDKTSFIVSARRTYLDVLAQPFILAYSDGATAGYFFQDFNAKIQHKINEKHQLYLSGYFGKDKFYLNEKDNSFFYDYKHTMKSGLDWGNAILAARWNYKISSKMFMNTTATYSNYHFNIEMAENYDYPGTEDDELYAFGYRSGISDWSVRSDINYFARPNHSMRFGLSDIYHTFTPGIDYETSKLGTTTTTEQIGSDNAYSHESSAYFEDDMKLGDRLKINIGAHFSVFNTQKTWFFIPQPRFSGNYQLNEKSSLKVGFSRMGQYLHLLSNTTIGLPTDLWLPTTKNVKPTDSWQYSLGYYRELPKKLQLSVEGYYKTMSNLIQYKEGVSFISGSTDWQNKVTTGKGWSYGVECLLEKKIGDFSGWMGYTLSWTKRQFDDLNNGEPFFYKYDRRHDISLAVTYDPKGPWDFGLVFVFSSGNSLTVPTHYFTAAPSDVTDDLFYFNAQVNSFEKVNNFKMPAYHRLDLGANKSIQKKHGTSIWSFSIYNVYNRKNPFMIYVGSLPYSSGNKLLQLSLFPIIPSISWKFQFDFSTYQKNKQ